MKKPMKFYERIPNFSPCRFTVRSDGSVFEAVAAMTSCSDKELIENSEHWVGFGYTIDRHEENHIKANKALLTIIDTYLPDEK